jgi:hypothetical protein
VPGLYWALSERPADGGLFRFRLIREGAETSQVDVELAAPEAAGVQRVSLRDHGVELEPGVAYRWLVIWRSDPERPSRDVLAEGWIERERGAGRPSADASRAQQVLDDAQAGYWYDALDGLSQLLAAHPGQADLRRARASLLHEAGLASLSDTLD